MCRHWMWNSFDLDIDDIFTDRPTDEKLTEDRLQTLVSRRCKNL